MHGRRLHRRLRPRRNSHLRLRRVDRRRLWFRTLHQHPVRLRQVRRRKFGAGTPRSLGERAKQARFLQYRGFDAEQLRATFREESGEGDDAPDITPDITFEAE